MKRTLVRKIRMMPRFLMKNLRKICSLAMVSTFMYQLLSLLCIGHVIWIFSWNSMYFGCGDLHVRLKLWQRPCVDICSFMWCSMSMLSLNNFQWCLLIPKNLCGYERLSWMMFIYVLTSIVDDVHFVNELLCLVLYGFISVNSVWHQLRFIGNYFVILNDHLVCLVQMARSTHSGHNGASGC